MTEAPQTQVSPSQESKAGDPQLNHLAQLHRMSRTAGLGSSDYTAVNTASVIAVLLGTASALALMTPIFLLLPVVGLVIAIMAIVQIRRSNRTQTGLGLAILGLVLCFAFSGFTGYKYYKQQNERDQDITQLNDLLHQFGDHISQQQYDQAYAMTDTRFRDQIPLTRFQKLFGDIAAAPTVGNVTDCRSNGLFEIDVDPETDLRTAVGIALIDTKKAFGDHSLRTEFRYRNAGTGWMIYAIPEWFSMSPPKSTPSNASGASGSGGTAPMGPAGPPLP